MDGVDALRGRHLSINEMHDPEERCRECGSSNLVENTAAGNLYCQVGAKRLPTRSVLNDCVLWV